MQTQLFKQIKIESLYNMTQDNEHLVIFDTRNKEVFLEGFLRKSYWFDPNMDFKEIDQLIAYLEKVDEYFKRIRVVQKGSIQIKRLVVIQKPGEPVEKI